MLTHGALAHFNILACPDKQEKPRPEDRGFLCLNE